jgi:hypothetical protein
VNNEFSSFLFSEGIQHQTSCPGTPPQNGVAKRKYRHILEVVHSLMFTMNVPKFLWSEAVMTVTYLIIRTSSRILGMKTPYELIFGKMNLSSHQKYLGALALLEIIGRQLESWILELSSASLLVIQ